MSTDAAVLQQQQGIWNNSQNELAPAALGVPSLNDRALGSLLIIDRRAFARDCLATALRAIRSNRAVEVFSDVNELQRKAALQLAPSLILFCYHESVNNMAFLDDEIMILTKAFRTAPVVLLSDVDDVTVIARALESGARGYIPASFPLRIAIQAIQIVEAGGSYLPVDSFMALRRQSAKIPAATDGIGKTLTLRQKAVLLTLRQGKANKVIALELNMRESTVKVHVRNIMKKLNARNRTEVSYKTNGMFTDSGIDLHGPGDSIGRVSAGPRIWHA